MPKPPPRFIVSLDRLDGGESIDELEVHDVQLRDGIVTISDGHSRLFAGDAWSWLEVKRIDENADVSAALPPAKAQPQPTARSPRQTRSRK